MGIQKQKNMMFIILYTLHDEFCSEYSEKLRSSGETLSPGVSMLVPRRFGREACFTETPVSASSTYPPRNRYWRLEIEAYSYTSNPHSRREAPLIL